MTVNFTRCAAGQRLDSLVTPASLVRAELIEAAESQLRLAESQRDQAAQAVAAVESAIEEARAFPGRLLARAVACEVVTDSAVLAAQAAEPDLRRVLVFRKAVAEQFEARARTAAVDLASARDEACHPVLARLIDLRVSAAVQADMARQAGSDPAAMEEARQAFDRTSIYLDYVKRNSALLRGFEPPAWPTTSAYETKAWRRFSSFGQDAHA